jgi:hypothetical protein
MQDTGLMDKIRMYKTILTEPRASDNENFDDIIKQFYKVIQQCAVQGLLDRIYSYNSSQELGGYAFCKLLDSQ